MVLVCVHMVRSLLDSWALSFEWYAYLEWDCHNDSSVVQPHHRSVGRADDVFWLLFFDHQIRLRLPSCLVKMAFHLVVLNVYCFGALNVVRLSLSSSNIVLRQSQVFLFFIKKYYFKTLGCCILCALQKF